MWLDLNKLIWLFYSSLSSGNPISLPKSQWGNYLQNYSFCFRLVELIPLWSKKTDFFKEDGLVRKLLAKFWLFLSVSAADTTLTI